MTKAMQQKALEALKNIPVFSSVQEEQLLNILKNFAGVETFKKEETIFSPDSGFKIYGVLLKGEARVLKDYVTVSILKEGQGFGLAALYREEKGFVNTIEAKTACKVLCIQKEGIDQLLIENPNFSFSYISYLSGRIYYLNEKIEAYTAPSAEEKLLNFLESIRPKNGIITDVSIAELTRQVNVSRASLYRALDALQKREVLRYEHKQIIFL